MSNNQKSFRLFLLQLFNIFFRILASLNKAAFCNNLILMVISSFSNNASSLLLTASSVPITSMCLTFHSYLIFCFSSWYFSTFSLSFSFTKWTSIWNKCFVLHFYNNTVKFYSHNKMITLNVPQNLILLIFSNLFQLVLKPSYIFAHVILMTDFPVNQSGNIIVPLPIYFLCEHLKFTTNMICCFTFLNIQHIKWGSH